jgi:two-component system, OmpR family, osmolarity sensor histidine kinase EnvZ
MLYSKLRLRSLFARTATAIAAALIAYAVFSHVVLGYYMIGPVAKRSAEDLAVVMILTAEAASDSSQPGGGAPIPAAPDGHELRVADPDGPLIPARYNPYLGFLEEALHRQTGQPVIIGRDPESSQEWLWAEIATAGGALRLGFTTGRLKAYPGVAVFVLMLVGATLTFGTALVYVRRITRPLGRLAEAAGRVGHGEFASSLPETGPEEIAGLTRTFNLMTRQVKELLAARTTMLAGISHDLRTPLSRLSLSLELLRIRPDAEVIEGMRRDLEAMNALIGEFLDIARGLEEEERVPVSLREMLDGLADDARRSGSMEVCVTGPPCEIVTRPVALHRVLANLVDNAVRYGGGKPVEIILRRDTDDCSIHVRDHGPGIPEAERELVFRPFYRIEQSRSAESGGSGLGLAVARQLAEVNGWELRLLPGPGCGTEAVLGIAGAGETSKVSVID